MRGPVLLLALLALVMSAVATAAPTTTATQLTTRFKAASGEKLIVNKTTSQTGHYRAYDLGVPTAFKKAKWGTFVVYLVTGTDVEAEVTDLLSHTRTGELGTPSAGSIYWEQGATIHGQIYWQAKRRYGHNVVVTWIGLSAAKKTDASWKRLHRTLSAATK